MQDHPSVVHSAAERTVMLVRMKAAVSAFYAEAISIGCHPFIEWTGLMAEYVKVAEEAHREGIDFTQLNRHSGARLPIQGFHLGYLNEKLDCIFSGQVKVVAGEVPMASEQPKPSRRKRAA